MTDSPAMSDRKKKTKSMKLVPLQDIPSPPSLYGQAASKQIQHKRDLIEAAHRLNPAFVQSAPGSFWSVEAGLKSGSIDDNGIKQQISIIEDGVNYNTRRFNALRAANDRLTKDLKGKLDLLNEEKKNYEELDSLLKAETLEGQRIEALEGEIVVENEIFRKSHNTRQLEYMLNRLKKNQLKFDVHMSGMEGVMEGIKKEVGLVLGFELGLGLGLGLRLLRVRIMVKIRVGTRVRIRSSPRPSSIILTLTLIRISKGAEVRMLRRSLDIGLAKAVVVMEGTEVSLATARKDRAVAIAQRRLEFETAHTLQEWMKQRELEKEELAMEMRGDLNKEEESFLRAQILDKLEKMKGLQRANEDSIKRFTAMEEAFSQLKQITGVSSLTDMHEKFSSQKGSKNSLLQEVKESEERLEAVKAGQLRHEQKFQELKTGKIAIGI
jgi:hypothetical protein